MKLLYYFPILLDAATAAVCRKGDVFLAKWADIMTGTGFISQAKLEGSVRSLLTCSHIPTTKKEIYIRKNMFLCLEILVFSNGNAPILSGIDKLVLLTHQICPVSLISQLYYTVQYIVKQLQGLI